MRTLNKNTLDAIQNYITAYQTEYGVSPSYRKIMKEINMSSLNLVQRYVLALEKSGRIERTNIGNIKTPCNLKKSKSTMAPLVGYIACGDPTEEESNIEENIELPDAIFGGGDLFMLHATGDSMINAGIFDGDLIFVEQCNTARNGDIVVALLDDSATVKTFYKENGHIRLQPENDRMEPFILDSVTILGKVYGVLRLF